MKKILLSAFITSVITIASVANVFAAGSVSVTGDKDTAAVGDVYTVTVNFEDAEGASVAPDVSVNYDVNRLSFLECSTEYGGGGGGYITLSDSGANISFSILSGGQADVDVTAIFDGDGTTAQVVTATVMVDGEDTAAVNELARDEGSGLEAGTVTAADGSLVSSVFADEFMPVGFYKTTVSFGEQMVEAAQFDMGGIVLLYVADADGNNGNFKVYDQVTGELSDFLQISGIENRFIIALKADESVTVPKDFVKTTLQWNAQVLEAYSYMGDATFETGPQMNEFFLLYAVSSEGNKGWYMYDQKDGTYQRFVEGLYAAGASGSDSSLLSQITSAQSSDDSEGGVNVVLIIAIALGVLLLALIITVIIMAVKLHEFNSYEYIDEDEEYEDEEEESFPQRLAREEQQRKQAALVEPKAPVKADEAKKAEVEKKKEEKAASDSDEMPDEMPKTKNIYEQYREEDTKKEEGRIETVEPDIDDVDDEELIDDDDIFSPREKRRSEKPSRADKKALKQEEKARKKAEKKMKKEYGEFGPVDWDAWQEAVEGGEKTAASAQRSAAISEEPVKKHPAEEEGFVVRPKQEKAEEDKKTSPREKAPASMPEGVTVTPVREPVSDTAKLPPMDMMKGIPANDNKQPVQPKPVQQFDFDDDFEFEFLDLDDDD